MTAKLKGMVDLTNVLRDLPANLDAKVLRAGLRAGVAVIADEAKALARSPKVKPAIQISSRSEPGVITAKVKVAGKGAYLAPWLEFGTAPHFIAVEDAQREGRTIGRINRLHREGSLVINGKFVGATVHHPGAKPYPFMRPALDNKLSEAIAAIGDTIRTKLTPAGLAGPAAPQDEGDA